VRGVDGVGQGHIYVKKEPRIYTCPVCGTSDETSSYNKKYCSKACREIDNPLLYKRETYVVICDICNKEFTAYQPGVKRCSAECRKKATKDWFKNVEKSCIVCGMLFRGGYSTKYCESCRTKTRCAQHMTIVPRVRIEEKNLIEGNRNTWYSDGFSAFLKKQVKDRDGWQCYICHKETGLHIHHIIPRVDGGLHEADNLITLCGGCHRSMESGNVEKAIIKCVQRAMDNLVFD